MRSASPSTEAEELECEYDAESGYAWYECDDGKRDIGGVLALDMGPDAES